jgi:hypothetical protein
MQIGLIPALLNRAGSQPRKSRVERRREHQEPDWFSRRD